MLNYFNAVAGKLANTYELSSTVQNHSDKGFQRELAVKEILSRHLPMRLEAKLGGHIFGYNQEDSKQIDIMVVNDTGINFLEHEKPFYPIENIAAAFTIKSKISSNELKDCLENLASIPQVFENIIRFDSLHPSAFLKFRELFPVLFIFAYSGIDGATLLKEVEKFYSENSHIPINRRPAGILVNKQAYIKRNVSPTQDLEGNAIPPNEFRLVKLGNGIEGYPFLHIFNSINDYGKALLHMSIDYSYYFDKELKDLYKSL